jgi:hypothetical protein
MTQREFVINRLQEKGEITRNECLKHFISRLSAIIYDLKQEGWECDTYYRPITKDGKKIGEDYVYKAIKILK